MRATSILSTTTCHQLEIDMHQYRVELRTGHGASKFIDVMADDHYQAAMRAERQTGLKVLSTEFIN